MINTTKEEALETLNEMLIAAGIKPSEVDIDAFGLKGGETNKQIHEWVNDLVNDIHTEMCEAKSTCGYTREYMEEL